MQPDMVCDHGCTTSGAKAHARSLSLCAKRMQDAYVCARSGPWFLYLTLGPLVSAALRSVVRILDGAAAVRKEVDAINQVLPPPSSHLRYLIPGAPTLASNSGARQLRASVPVCRRALMVRP